MLNNFKDELLSDPPSFICSKWLFDRVPFIFNSDLVSFLKWKEEVGMKLQVDPRSIVLTGSACCGFSLNPYKNFKIFDDTSDLDVAIVSHIHFDIAWRTLRNIGTKRFDLTPIQKASYNDHIKRYIYWGTIATDRLLEILPFGRDWSFHLLELSKQHPANDKLVNIRLYKDFDSLRAYHVNNLQNLRTNLYATK